MEATNYLRNAIELSKRGSNPIPGHYWVTSSRAQAAPKFTLPFGGRLFDTDLREMPTPVRLPFPMVVLEFPVHEYPLRSLLESLPEEKRNHTGADDHSARDRIIVIAEQDGDEPITLTLITREMNTDNWRWVPFTVAIASKREITMENPTGLWMAVKKRHNNEKGSLNEEWMSKLAGSMMKTAFYAVYDMVFALDTNRASVTTVEPRKLNKAAKKRGALPFDTYKVLTILPPSEDKPEPKESTSEASDRPTPREHERRGHWRRYKSGKEVFIEKLTVNKGVGGKVIKDYQFKI